MFNLQQERDYDDNILVEEEEMEVMKRREQEKLDALKDNEDESFDDELEQVGSEWTLLRCRETAVRYDSISLWSRHGCIEL